MIKLKKEFVLKETTGAFDGVQTNKRKLVIRENQTKIDNPE